MSYAERYVRSDAAGGGNGTTDTNSGANGAYTLAEAAALVATGIRFNLKSGTYTLSANVTTQAGATEAPNQWRGFQTTPGDLHAVGRSAATGQLVSTNFPVIDGGSLYRMTFGADNSVHTIKFTFAGNNSVMAAGAEFHWFRCVVQNTHTTGGSAQSIAIGTNYNSCVDCDLLVASSNSALRAAAPGRGNLIGCLIKNTGTADAASIGVQNNDVGGAVVNCLIVNFGIGIDVVSNSHTIFANTIVDCVDAIRVGGGAPAIVNNLAVNVSGYLIRGNTASGNPLIWNNAATTPGSGRLNTAALGSVIEELSAITLSGDPLTNKSGGDYTLDATANEGALCRGGSLLWSGESDVGAVQHADAGGTSRPTHALFQQVVK